MGSEKLSRLSSGVETIIQNSSFKIFSMDLQWHVIHVLSRNEKKVSERLEKKGVWVYLPVQKQLRQWSDRKKWVEIPVLSGYVFVKTNAAQHLQILETTGVSRFLKFEKKPVIISEIEMINFQKFIKKAETRPIEFTTERLPIGTHITVQSGLFKGFSGEIAMHKGKYKLMVRLSNFGNFLIEFLPAEVAVCLTV